MSILTTKYLLIGVASFATSAVSLYYLIPYLTKKAFIDIPNARSSHKKVTPRGGGLGVLIGLATGSLLAYYFGLPLPHWSFFIGISMMAGISFMDDKNNLPAGLRLAVHMAAVILVLYYTGGLKKLPFPFPFNIELGVFGYVVAAVWIVAVINFFNFLDGIDGYAGTQAFLAATGIALIQTGAIGTVGISVAFSCLGFLVYNWHPAKVFMGDVGSVSLGFAFAALPFYSENTSSDLLVFSVALFLWFFLVDGALTLITRIVKREKIWEPHRTHLYQRLNQKGWPHHKVVLLNMGMAAIIVFLQVYSFQKSHSLEWPNVWVALVLFGLFSATAVRRQGK